MRKREGNFFFEGRIFGRIPVEPLSLIFGERELHDLRHTYTTNARKAGVHETVIMKLTGHKTRSMFTRYNSVDEADARQALDLMEAHFVIKHQANSQPISVASPSS